MHQVYEDQDGSLYYEVAPGTWLFDANRCSLDTGGKTCGVIVPGHTVDRSELTPLDGVRLGFYGTPKPRRLTYAEIVKKPGNYESDTNPAVYVVTEDGQVVVISDGKVVTTNPVGHVTHGLRIFKPSTKKIEVK